MTRSIIVLGTALALGSGAGLILWGLVVDGEEASPVLHTGLGVAVGMFVGFPVWAVVGQRLRSVVRPRFASWLLLGVGLGFAFGGVTLLLWALLTGRLGEDAGIASFRFPVVVGLWNAVLLGIGSGCLETATRTR